jgi:O-antigen/teichoic acid export membrane protein
MASVRAWMWAVVTGAVIAVLVGAVLRWRRRRRGSEPLTEPWALRYALPILLVGAAAAAGAFTLAYRSTRGLDKDRVDVGIKAATATAAVAAGGAARIARASSNTGLLQFSVWSICQRGDGSLKPETRPWGAGS